MDFGCHDSVKGRRTGRLVTDVRDRVTGGRFTLDPLHLHVDFGSTRPRRGLEVNDYRVPEYRLFKYSSLTTSHCGKGNFLTLVDTRSSQRDSSIKNETFDFRNGPSLVDQMY